MLCLYDNREFHVPGRSGRDGRRRPLEEWLLRRGRLWRRSRFPWFRLLRYAQTLTYADRIGVSQAVRRLQRIHGRIAAVGDAIERIPSLHGV